MASKDRITISGIQFAVPNRYEEGHELTAGEASALNQTLHENLRNNFAKKVSEATNGQSIDDEDVREKLLALLQPQLDEYADNYEFGVRTGGGPIKDPVEAEAMRIARDKIREHLKRKGTKLKDVVAADITAAAERLLERNPEIRALAKQRVEEAQLAAAEDLDALVASIPQKPAEEATTE